MANRKRAMDASSASLLHPATIHRQANVEGIRNVSFAPETAVPDFPRHRILSRSNFRYVGSRLQCLPRPFGDKMPQPYDKKARGPLRLADDEALLRYESL